jgi:hypothetical protein
MFYVERSKVFIGPVGYAFCSLKVFLSTFREPDVRNLISYFGDRVEHVLKENICSAVFKNSVNSAHYGIYSN